MVDTDDAGAMPSSLPLRPVGATPLAPWWALALALLLLTAAAWVRLSGQDQALLLQGQAVATEAAPGLWSALSVLGLGWSGLILVCAADRPGNGRAITAMLLTLPAATLCLQLGKRWAAEPRPAAVLGEPLRVLGERLIGHSSMPSGHSLTATAVALLLALAVCRGRGARGLLLLGASGVMCSRVLVGAHWPADVLAGGALGLLLASAAWVATEHLSTLRTWAASLAQPARRRAIAVLELGLAAGLLLTPTGHPDAAWLQWLLATLALHSAWQRWPWNASR